MMRFLNTVNFCRSVCLLRPQLLRTSGRVQKKMNGSLILALGLGFVLGLKHATEADHLVAVTTIVSEQRSIWRSGMVGALWGVGHTASLLAAGILVIVLGIAIP